MQQLYKGWALLSIIVMIAHTYASGSDYDPPPTESIRAHLDGAAMHGGRADHILAIHVSGDTTQTKNWTTMPATWFDLRNNGSIHMPWVPVCTS